MSPADRSEMPGRPGGTWGGGMWEAGSKEVPECHLLGVALGQARRPRPADSAAAESRASAISGGPPRITSFVSLTLVPALGFRA